jgi:hypothetical protein
VGAADPEPRFVGVVVPLSAEVAGTVVERSSVAVPGSIVGVVVGLVIGGAAVAHTLLQAVCLVVVVGC